MCTTLNVFPSMVTHRTHRVSLDGAADEQSDVRGQDAVLHVTSSLVQSCNNDMKHVTTMGVKTPSA